MKKFLSRCVVAVACASVHATPFKALYAEVEAVPSGAGVVYMSPKNAEDEGYVYDQSEDWDETAYMMWVGGENSDGADYPGFTGGTGLYEVLIKAEPEAGYEVVCVAGVVKEDGIYTEEDCFAVIHGESAAAGFTFDFDYSTITEMGVKINVNNVEHPQDGHSSDGPDRDAVFKDFNAYSSDEPDTYVYVIFRKIGDELPKFVSEGGEGIQGVKSEAKEGATYNVAGQQVVKAYKGIVIKNGQKVILK